MPELLPLFLNVTGRQVVLVGGGRVAAAKLRQLLAVGARVRVIAPEISNDLEEVARPFQGRDRGAESPAPQLNLTYRPFAPSDLDDAWLVVAAATPEANREVAHAAEQRRLFVNAVDDPANASAYLSGVVRRDGVTIAISTSGDAPALTALLREAIERLLPHDLRVWMDAARGRARAVRRADRRSRAEVCTPCAEVFRRQARRTTRHVAGSDSRADDSRRAARPPRCPPEGRRSVRVRSRRRGSARAAARRRSVRHRPRGLERDRGAGDPGHSGDASRRLLGVPRRVGSRRDRIRVGDRSGAAEPDDHSDSHGP